MSIDIENLRSRVESRLHEATERRSCSAGLPVGATSAFVSISPSRHLSVTLISPLFEGKDFDERNDIFWSLLEGGFEDAECGAIDFWQLLTMGEAERFYPTYLVQHRTPVGSA